MHALGWLEETSAPRLDPDADAGAFGQPGGARDARGGSDGGSFSEATPRVHRVDGQPGWSAAICNAREAPGDA